MPAFVLCFVFCVSVVAVYNVHSSVLSVQCTVFRIKCSEISNVRPVFCGFCPMFVFTSFFFMRRQGQKMACQTITAGVMGGPRLTKLLCQVMSEDVKVRGLL